jgi:hypothetical protein
VSLRVARILLIRSGSARRASVALLADDVLPVGGTAPRVSGLDGEQPRFSVMKSPGSAQLHTGSCGDTTGDMRPTTYLLPAGDAPSLESAACLPAPDGLKGEEIPLTARILQIVDIIITVLLGPYPGYMSF